ncbi:hypothetical protein F5X96DRAFT_630396 [Biscogniauxia mediterranea]|nr:hypothetical protein F5X96DRAFT_630396 [Biscogniauxia mediterranea]
MSANFVAWSGGGVDLAQDLFILALPFPYLRHLRLERKKKIATSIMFAVGALTVAFSIVRLTCIPKFTISVNTTLDAVPAILWSGLELYVGIICACLPSIYPLVAPVFSWVDNYFSPPQPAAQLQPAESMIRDRLQRNKKKYRPIWDITLTGMSTTKVGDEEAISVVVQPYTQPSDDEINLVRTSSTTR